MSLRDLLNNAIAKRDYYGEKAVLARNRVITIYAELERGGAARFEKLMRKEERAAQKYRKYMRKQRKLQLRIMAMYQDHAEDLAMAMFCLL